MDSYITSLMVNLGYLGMFLGMVLEAVIIIIPSELILATAGILAGQGIFSFSLAFLIGILGSVFCAIVIYAMGYFGGRKFIQTYGKFFFMKEEDIDKCDRWFNKYGLVAAFIGRNFPIIRTLISLPMGVSKVPFIKFVIYTTLGSIPWTFAFVYVGYALGNNWIILDNFVKKLKVPIYILLGVLVITYLYKKLKEKKMSK
ncbi:MAG TPA: DedA family protein [Candidatus Onthousia faecavium]|nr:DedA family protein [Candidatus Onthousia faecavium]